MLRPASVRQHRPLSNDPQRHPQASAAKAAALSRSPGRRTPEPRCEQAESVVRSRRRWRAAGAPDREVDVDRRKRAEVARGGSTPLGERRSSGTWARAIHAVRGARTRRPSEPSPRPLGRHRVAERDAHPSDHERQRAAETHGVREAVARRSWRCARRTMRVELRGIGSGAKCDGGSGSSPTGAPRESRPQALDLVERPAARRAACRARCPPSRCRCARRCSCPRACSGDA